MLNGLILKTTENQQYVNFYVNFRIDFHAQAAMGKKGYVYEFPPLISLRQLYG